jgi:hypothetical protein
MYCRGFTNDLVCKYGQDIIIERGLFSIFILFIYFSFCLLKVKNLTINSNNTGKLSVNQLTMKFNVGNEWVGTTINHSITKGIYKLYYYLFSFYFILFFFFFFQKIKIYLC